MLDSGCGDLDRFTPTQPNTMNQPQLLKFNQVPRRGLLGRFQQLCKVRRGEYDFIRVRPDLDQLIECYQEARLDFLSSHFCLVTSSWARLMGMGPFLLRQYLTILTAFFKDILCPTLT